MQQHNFFLPHPLGLWGGAKKVKISITNIQFQRFLNQTLCVFSQMKDINRLDRFSRCRLGHAPGIGLGGAGGVKI